MRNIFITVFALAFTLSAFADDSSTVVVRTLSCKGNLKGPNNTTKEFTARIEDTKTTFTHKKETFTDYWSTLTFNDLKADKGELFGNLTSVESGRDIQNHRDAPRDGSWQGLTFYEIFKDEASSENQIDEEGNSTREGLIILSSTCTTEQLPNAKKCPNPRGKRHYEIAVRYGEEDDKNTQVYVGEIECALNSKGIAE